MSRFDELEDLAAIQRRPRWPGLLLLLALLGGLGYFAWGLAHPISPLKALVLVEMEGAWLGGSKPAAILTDEINAGLKALGFEPILPGAPGALAIFESGLAPEAAARRLGARFFITGEIKLSQEALEIGEGYSQTHYIGRIRVQGHDRAAEEGEISGWVGAKAAARAASLAADAAAVDALAVIVPYLTHDPALSAAVEGDPEVYKQLKGARAFMDLKATALRVRAEAFTARAERWRRRIPKLQIHGIGDEHDGLSGIGVGGLLFKAAGIRIKVPVEGDALRYEDDREAAGWLKADGGRAVAWSGYNLLGWPSPAREADALALTEDLYGYARALTLIQGGARREIRRDEAAYFEWAKPSPSAAKVAALERRCRRCDPDLVIWAATGEELARRPAGAVEGFEWWDDARLLFLEPTRALPEQADAERAPSGGLWVWAAGEAPKLWAVSAEGGVWGWISCDGARVALTTRDEAGDGLTVLDLADGAARRLPADRRLKTPHIAGDAVVFTVHQGRSDQVGYLNLNDEAPIVLTDDDLKAQHPYLMGGRVYFELIDRDPTFTRRLTSTLVSLPVPP
ncbi:hypothetical protein KKF91_12020 [Myxococcota bacterium]|nr:hypothetical protein [Myxococcota bacterium]MBU1431257.1 hypothetical protein [Myxococcota bacterium]MBU1898054.1 hypothetical protein [Myxococcota bacterium]